MVKIFLNKPNKYALIDDEDYPLVSKYKWYIAGRGYVLSANFKFKMHRLIMNPKKGMYVDHINHNLLDNRRSNLRICTPAQNNANKSMKRNNTSGYKGVSYIKSVNKWRACINPNQKQIDLGSFFDVKDAARAYNKAAKEIYGEFAWINEGV